MKKIQKDQYQKARGTARVLDITCENCAAHVAYYQKDGPGPLKRMYVDRFMDFEPRGKELVCANCKAVLGSYFIFQKETRPAYRLFVGSIHKQLTSLKQLKDRQ